MSVKTSTVCERPRPAGPGTLIPAEAYKLTSNLDDARGQWQMPTVLPSSEVIVLN